MVCNDLPRQEDPLASAGRRSRALKRNLSEVSNDSSVIFLGDSEGGASLEPSMRECVFCGHGSDEPDPCFPNNNRRWAYYALNEPRFHDGSFDPLGHTCFYCDQTKRKRFKGLSSKHLLIMMGNDPATRVAFDQALEQVTATMIRQVTS